MRSAVPSRPRSPVAGVLVVLASLLLVAGLVGRGADTPAASAAAPTTPSPTGPNTTPSAPATGSPSVPTGTGTRPPAALPPYVVPAAPPIARRPQLPGGGYRVFGHHRFLVAYWDVDRFTPREVRRLGPAVSFVSYQ